MKKLFRSARLAAWLALAAGGATAALAAELVASPDGHVGLTFTLRADGAPVYRIDTFGQPLVLESRLGFKPDFSNGFTQVGAATATHDTSWEQPYGERRRVPDRYRELTVDLRHRTGPVLRITFRAYDEGVAWRCAFPAQPTPGWTAGEDLTEFRFPAKTRAWQAHGPAGGYTREPTAASIPAGGGPLTLELADGGFAALAGGDLKPWHLLIVGRSAGDLLERNYLRLNLTPPAALGDTSWIKPGKAMRDPTLTTVGSKAVIDFAATAGLGYVHLGPGWDGPAESDPAGDMVVRAPGLNLPEIVRYGRDHGVGVILSVNHRRLERDREHVFPLLEQWGVQGVNLGSVDSGEPGTAKWLAETSALAAKHHLVLTVRDEHPSASPGRTWPNLLLTAGTRDDEFPPAAAHHCTLPFTRFVTGPGDCPVGYHDPRLTRTTHAHRLAMSVVSFSPIPSVFDGERPSASAGGREMEFFRRVPTVWDDTKVLAGQIARYAALARRSGDDWFVGAINGPAARRLNLPLKFLDPGRAYIAHRYTDDSAAPAPTKVAYSAQRVFSTDQLELSLLAAGGAAFWITPDSKRR